jgi:NifU-like protein
MPDLPAEMNPVALLDDHARRPRNVGKLLNASAVGDVGSIVVGDALRFYIQVSSGKISSAKFQVFNCTDQVAASSITTELVVGKTLAEAKKITHNDICQHLGGADFTYLPPRLWALDGLRSAIAAYESGDIDSDHELDPLLCRCFGISEETVRQAIRVSGCATVDELVNATGAGTGCGTCRTDMSKLIDETTQAAAAPVEKPAQRTGPSGRIQTLLRIQKLVAEKLQPSWKQNGAVVELWDFDGRVIKVRMSGQLSSNAEAHKQARDDLAQLIKAEIDAALSIEVSP